MENTEPKEAADSEEIAPLTEEQEKEIAAEMAKRRDHIPRELAQAFEQVRQAAESIESSKSPGFYQTSVTRLAKLCQAAATKYRNFPGEVGIIERRQAAHALSRAAEACGAILGEFNNPAIKAEDVKVTMDTLPPIMERAGNALTRALAASAGVKLPEQPAEGAQGAPDPQDQAPVDA